MGLLDKLFGKKKGKLQSYEAFWDWFSQHEQDFYQVVKMQKNIESNFFKKLLPKLAEIKDGFYFVAGMRDNDTVELVFTTDGNLKNIVFVEELVDAAPPLEHWQFTALKPERDISDITIKMENFNFNGQNLSFYPIEHANFPDEIDIVVAHPEYHADEKIVTGGTLLFLDHYLGELRSLTTIDNIAVISNIQADQTLIPIEKLKDYLIWREKEFIEKHEGIRYNTENDAYSTFEATLDNGLPMIGIVNTTLLDWDSKASHPWLLYIEMTFDGRNNNGLPDRKTYEQLNAIEEEIMSELKDHDGYLNVARETSNGSRMIFFACKDFRRPSKLLHQLTEKYSGEIDLDYDFIKDKYWRELEKFIPN